MKSLDEINAHALRVAEEAHAGQFRKDGTTPYIEHPKAVAARVPPHLRAIALLHDAVEDSGGLVTIDRLRQEGLPENVCQAVDALTKREGELYADYLERVARNPEALRVKIADLRHNLSGDPSAKNRAKYEEALPKLLAAVRGDN